MIKFRKYTSTGHYSTPDYVFGFNLYDIKTQPTLDIIFGKKIYVFCIVRKKK